MFLFQNSPLGKKNHKNKIIIFNKYLKYILLTYTYTI